MKRLKPQNKTIFALDLEIRGKPLPLQPIGSSRLDIYHMHIMDDPSEDLERIRNGGAESTTTMLPTDEKDADSSSCSEDHPAAKKFITQALSRSTYLSALSKDQIKNFSACVELVKLPVGETLPLIEDLFFDEESLSTTTNSMEEPIVEVQAQDQILNDAALNQAETKPNNLSAETSSEIPSHNEQGEGHPPPGGIISTATPRRRRYLYIVRKGSVAVRIRGRIRIISEGSIVGEESILFESEMPKAESLLQATTDDCELYRLDRDLLLNHVLPTLALQREFARHAQEYQPDGDRCTRIQDLTKVHSQFTFLWPPVQHIKTIGLQDFCLLMTLDHPQDILFSLLSDDNGRVSSKNLVEYLDSNPYLQSNPDWNAILDNMIGEEPLSVGPDQGRLTRSASITHDDLEVLYPEILQELRKAASTRFQQQQLLSSTVYPSLSEDIKVEVQHYLQRSQGKGSLELLSLAQVLENLPIIKALSREKENVTSPEEFVRIYQQYTGRRLTPFQLEFIQQAVLDKQNALESTKQEKEGKGKEINSKTSSKIARAFTLQDPQLPFSERLKLSLNQFFLTACASGVGLSLLYPLDFLQTRVMDNKNTSINVISHLRNVIAREGGIAALWRGLTPPLICIGPIKTMKFAVNDLLRNVAATSQTVPKNDTKLHFGLELVAGGAAGACQLLITNPMELVKIRLQLQPKTLSFTQVLASIPSSLAYRGAAACLMRDIPFSAIYFASYAAGKDYLVQENRRYGNDMPLTLSQVTLAGTMAAFPASILTSPADLIKTRLQSNNHDYLGVRDCFRRILAEEGGIRALFKGGEP